MIPEVVASGEQMAPACPLRAVGAGKRRGTIIIMVERVQRMTTLDQFFHAPADLVLHPRLRSWKERLRIPGVTATVSVFRPETVIGRSHAELNVHFIENGKVAPLETVLWDDDLNLGLVDLGVRAESAEQEAERFSLGLRAAIRMAAREFGDGFVNSVLIKFVQESDLVDDPARDDGPPQPGLDCLP